MYNRFGGFDGSLLPNPRNGKAAPESGADLEKAERDQQETEQDAAQRQEFTQRVEQHHGRD